MNSKGHVVLKVNSFVVHEGGVDTATGKRRLEAAVQQVFGSLAVELRAGYLHKHPDKVQQLLGFLPVTLTDCTELKDVRAKLHKALSVFVANLQRQGGLERHRTGPSHAAGPMAGPSLIDMPEEIFRRILSFVDIQPKMRVLSTACSTIVSGSSRWPIIMGAKQLPVGPGVSLLARCPKVETLQLQSVHSLRVLEGFLRIGWSFGCLRTLILCDWAVDTSTNLEVVVRELLRRPLETVVRLCVKLSNHQYNKALQASGYLVHLMPSLRNLESLEVRATGWVGLSKGDITALALACRGMPLRRLELDLNCREGAAGMPLDSLLESLPGLVSLRIFWRFLLAEGSGRGAPDEIAVTHAKELCREGIGMVAAAVPHLTKLRILSLMPDITIDVVSNVPVLLALAKHRASKLHELEMNGFEWADQCWCDLQRSGQLREVKRISLAQCGLQWSTVFKFLQEATRRHGGLSNLPELQHVDLSWNPLFPIEEGEEEVDLELFPSAPPVLPPRLQSIRIKSVQLSKALKTKVREVLGPVKLVTK